MSDANPDSPVDSRTLVSSSLSLLQYDDSHPDVAAAKAAVLYLNSQLTANHGISQLRLSSPRVRNQSDVEHKNSYAWIQYCSRQSGIPALNFTFEKPRLFFLCDHEAILVLRLSSIAPVLQSQQGATGVIQRDPFDLLFRVTMERRTIFGNDVKIGTHNSRIHLLVFDFEHAKMLQPEEPKLKDYVNRHHLEHRLASYLRALHAGGHHVLLLPPEFDGSDLRSLVRLSLSDIEEAKTVPMLDNIKGFTTDMIDGYLTLLWYTCAFVARDRRERGEITRWDDTTSLAQYDTRSNADPPKLHEWRFSFECTPPSATILCSQEVILRFKLTKIYFYTSTGNGAYKEIRDYRDKDSEIALIVNIDTKTTDGLRIDPRNATLSPQHSKRSSDFHDGHHEDAYNQLTMFFVESYFRLVAATQLQYLCKRMHAEYQPSFKVASTFNVDDSWWALERDYGTNVNALAAAVKDTKMGGFDIVVAIPRSSINAQFLRIFKGDDTLRLLKGEGFEIEIKAMTVRLVDLKSPQAAEDDGDDDDIDIDNDIYYGGNNDDDEHSHGGNRGGLLHSADKTSHQDPDDHAIVTVHVMGGTFGLSMNVSKLNAENRGLEEALGECHLAFEVPLKQRILGKNDKYPITGKSHLETRVVFLDLLNARFSPQHSVFQHEEYSDMSRIHRCAALVQCIKENCFTRLAETGKNIVASVSIHNSNASSFYKFTSMTFCTFIADNHVTATGSDQILFLLGMTGKRQPPRLSSFVPSRGWILPDRFSHGLLAISGNVFRTGLRALFTRINAITTLVPVSMSSYTRGQPLVQLWHKDPERKPQDCKWSGVGGENDNCTQFEWKYNQHQLVEEESSLLDTNWAVDIYCTTHNRLELPDVSTFSHGKLVIKMSGDLRLRLQSARGHESLSMESVATWSVCIILKTSVKGDVEVDIDGPDIYVMPPKAPPRWSAYTGISEVQTTLQQYLPKRGTFKRVLQELKELEGEWKYYYPTANFDESFTLCTPTFNGDGDLLFEFRRSPQTVPSWRHPTPHANGQLSLNAPTSPQDAKSPQTSEGSGEGPVGQEQENVGVHLTVVEPKPPGQTLSTNDMPPPPSPQGLGRNARITTYNSRV